MRIVYCLDSICGIGGIQRVTLVKASALSEIEGNEVWIAVADNSGKRVYPLGPKVHLVDLGVNYYSDDWKSRWNVLKGIVLLRHAHRKKLASFLGEVRPDVVVSVGQSEKYFLPSIRGKWVKIREMHYSKNYRTVAASGMVGKILAHLNNLYDYVIKINGYDRIVVLTEEDKRVLWHSSKRVSVIPNPLSFGTGKTSGCDASRIIAVGRLTAQKNFASLIRAFHLIAHDCPEWCLDIFGDGQQRDYLSSLISDLGLEGRVRLQGSSDDIRTEMLQSSFLVMSSSFEGFCLALTEAMSCGLPVVAYDCPCGPKDIVTDGMDGFLVPTGDESALAGKMSLLISDTTLRKRMGMEAKKSSSRYSITSVVTMWMNLFLELGNRR